jgi:hypothetical protein
MIVNALPPLEEYMNNEHVQRCTVTVTCVSPPEVDTNLKALVRTPS